jgi:hypothetical protein
VTSNKVSPEKPLTLLPCKNQLAVANVAKRVGGSPVVIENRLGNMKVLSGCISSAKNRIKNT